MNIMLLGNGFDLHYKLPTQYQNFLHMVDYLSRNEISKFHVLADLFEDGELETNDWFLRDSFESYHEVYGKVEVDPAKIEYLQTEAKKNMWFQYLLRVFNKNVGWIDFEREIGRVCTSFGRFFEKINYRIKLQMEQVNISLVEILPDISDRYIVIEFFSFFLNEYVGSNGRCVKNFYSLKDEYILNNPVGSSNFELDKEKVISVLSEELNKLSKMLRVYLKCFAEKLCDQLISEKVIEPLGLQIDRAITFNYTQTFEKLHETRDSIIHIHGCTDNKIILGINPDKNDEIGTVDTTFIAFKKYFQRVLFQTDLEYLELINNLEDSAPWERFHLYVMGHSLDVTDADIIKQLFGAANAITIFCHCKEAIAAYIPNLIRIFGKEKFDSLRQNKFLRFRITATELQNVIKEQKTDYYSM